MSSAVAAGAAGVVMGTGAAPASAAPSAGAADVPFTPSGSLSSTNVQDALVELDSKTWFDVRVYGAVGDGSADDTLEIRAAIDAAAAAGGGTVLLPPGVYKITDKVVVPSGVDLWGCGGHKRTGTNIYSGTVINAVGATAQVVFQETNGTVTNTGGLSGNFVLQGVRSAASGPPKGLLHLDWCLERQFSAITVALSPSNGVVIDSAQNCTFTALQVTHCRDDGLVVNWGAAGNVFLRNEFNGCGGYNVALTNSAGSPARALVPTSPMNNLFLHCIAERGANSAYDPATPNKAALHVDKGALNTFDHCVFAMSPGDTVEPPQSSLVVLEVGTRTAFSNCYFTDNYNGTDLEDPDGLWAIRTTGFVEFLGLTNFNTTKGIYWHLGASARVLGDFEYRANMIERWSGATTGQGSSAHVAIQSLRQHWIRLDPNAPTGLRVSREDEPDGYRFQIGSQGEIQASDGTTYNARATWKLQDDGFGWQTTDDVLMIGGLTGGVARGFLTSKSTLNPTTTNIPDGTGAMYFKGNKFVVAYNDAGTIRYRTIELSASAPATWSTATP